MKKNHDNIINFSSAGDVAKLFYTHWERRMNLIRSVFIINLGNLEH